LLLASSIPALPLDYGLNATEIWVETRSGMRI
jgi:hypothetical protein